VRNASQVDVTPLLSDFLGVCRFFWSSHTKVGVPPLDTSQ
jgi:hypothetical protein